MTISIKPFRRNLRESKTPHVFSQYFFTLIRRNADAHAFRGCQLEEIRKYDTVIWPFQRNEALKASAMESAYSTADKRALAKATQDIEHTGQDREVLSYIQALSYATSALKQSCVSLGRLSFDAKMSRS